MLIAKDHVDCLPRKHFLRLRLSRAHMPDRDHIVPTEVKSLLNGARVLAMTFGAEDVAEELLDSVGAIKLLDKMDLADQLVPAILELAEARTAS